MALIDFFPLIFILFITLVQMPLLITQRFWVRHWKFWMVEAVLLHNKWYNSKIRGILSFTSWIKQNFLYLNFFVFSSLLSILGFLVDQLMPTLLEILVNKIWKLNLYFFHYDVGYGKAQLTGNLLLNSLAKILEPDALNLLIPFFPLPSVFLGAVIGIFLCWISCGFFCPLFGPCVSSS